MEAVSLIVGLIIGCLLCYFVLQPKIKNTNKINEDIERQNNQITAANTELKTQQQELLNQIQSLVTRKAELMADIDASKMRRDELNKYIQELRAKMDEDNDIIFQKSLDLMQEHLDQAAQNEAAKFQKAQEIANEEYLKTLEEAAEEFAATLARKGEELANVQTQLDTLRAKAAAAIEAAKREEEKLLELDKYKILVSELDLLEINRLREIAPYFRNPRAIYKIVWESYYRNSTTELINRVIGTGTHTGIYKITNLKNQKVYIGQATDLASRWKDHIKAGLGIDTPNNILYAAMLKDGVENFSFEVLEECERASLNDRETHYIQFYEAQSWGYNMTKGGARK